MSNEQSKNKKIPVVRFENVSRVYGDPNDAETVVKALDEVSFEIYKGEYVAITGPSGSGKSTLLHLLGLLDRQTSGDIFIDGVETDKLNDSQLAKLRNQKIGFVFQQFNLLRRTAAWKNVELPLIYSNVRPKERRERATRELETVGLGTRLNNMPSQLSGGQQQRVAIARALVTNPAILLADEPTGNLDSKSGAAIMQLFEELHQKGVTVVMVTHDPDKAKLADRQIIVKDGRVD
ncbi:macrolide ABC transporter ATP-binding protein [Candidatus Amesbacteria bacterium RIFOXYB1_FULL_44_23]|uniref:Macrolide ABC transporter ATP-binding protein n=1 Tax=Candidatus Amesbacteria bacterium RIFOXYB1_FULL_44_23 TaxID=1797263 RepID=A0A1F4ZR49_9BACT|nr:MAG: macrolide ABC transporter ATP-binding protein [Candidatus Amesbacteria bacterium RIFOXYB1_FULL_44_23]